MTPKHILVAEDESIIGFDLCETVQEAGYTAEGPHENLSSAMLAVQKHRPDLAILDVQLDDGVVFPLAEALIAEDVPVIFHSGQVSCEDAMQRYPGIPAMAKPCPPSRMIAAVQDRLQNR